MKIKLFLFFITLTLAPSAFSQEKQPDKRPQAYLFNAGSRTVETIQPQAYLSSSGRRTAVDGAN